MSKIAILTIHGIGQQKPGFATNFHKNLTHNLSNKDEVKCFEFEWQHLIEPVQDNLVHKLFGLSWRLARSFAITYIGDAVAYAKDSVFYKACHKELDAKLKEISDWVEDGKIYIVAHSLGTIISYNFIYNMQNIEALGNKIFRAKSTSWIDKLDTVFFLGSPLYIYSLQKDAGGKPIDVKNWINIYSPFDVIGYPIKKINEQFNQSNIQDVAVFCGGLKYSWNPLSHITYFDSNSVLRILSNKISGSSDSNL